MRPRCGAQGGCVCYVWAAVMLSGATVSRPMGASGWCGEAAPAGGGAAGGSSQSLRRPSGPFEVARALFVRKIVLRRNSSNARKNVKNLLRWGGRGEKAVRSQESAVRRGAGSGGDRGGRGSESGTWEQVSRRRGGQWGDGWAGWRGVGCWGAAWFGGVRRGERKQGRWLSSGASFWASALPAGTGVGNGRAVVDGDAWCGGDRQWGWARRGDHPASSPDTSPPCLRFRDVPRLLE